MTAIDFTESPRGRRLGAAADLAAWAATLGAMFAIGVGLKLAGTSQSARILLGEPLEMVGLMAVTTGLLRRRGQRWRDLGLARPASAWRTARLAAAGLVAAYGSGWALVFFLFPILGLPRPDLAIMALADSSPLAYALLIGLTWTTVAFGEELQFRGFVFSRLEALFGRSPGGTAAAWLGQGLLFGAMHGYQGWGGVLTTGAIGLVLGAVFLAGRRNLAASIVLHGLIDTFALTALFYAVSHHIPLP